MRIALLFTYATTLFVLTYAIYFMFGSVESSRAAHIEKNKEILLLVKKQEQIEGIKRDLGKTSQNRNEVISSLLERGQVLDFIVRIENSARLAGLSYEVSIVREITQEEIDREQAVRQKARRGGQASGEDQEEKLPGVLFRIDLLGKYSGIVRMLEAIASLPYYTHIESFSISRGGSGGEGEDVEASIRLMTFTKD